MQNNSLELFRVADGSSHQLYSVTSPGHRTDVRSEVTPNPELSQILPFPCRTLSFSSDNYRILSASAKLVKVWNRCLLVVRQLSSKLGMVCRISGELCLCLILCANCKCTRKYLCGVCMYLCVCTVARSTQQCVCTLTSRYALCSTFVPGDRYAIIGTKVLFFLHHFIL